MSTSRPAAESPAILVRNLHVRFGPVEALRGVDLECRRGSVTAVIGPNGAGKSTLVHVLADLVRPAAGAVEILGVRYGSAASTTWIRRNSGFLVSDEALFDYLTTQEFLDFLVASFGLGPEGSARARDLCALLELDDDLGRVIGGLSRGNRKKLATAAALIHAPAVLVLDEPFEALDPMAVVKLRDHLRDLADKGHCILVTSHILSALEEIADEVVVLHLGQIRVLGTLATVRKQVAGLEGGAGLEAVLRDVVGAPEKQR